MSVSGTEAVYILVTGADGVLIREAEKILVAAVDDILLE